MKPHLLIALSLCVAAGCNAPKTQDENPQDTTVVAKRPPGFFNIDSLQHEIENAIMFQRQELRADPDKIKGYLTRLDTRDPVSIPLAVHFIEGYPEPAGAAVYDTLYTQFVSVFYGTAANFFDLINTEKYANLLNEYDSEQSAESANLQAYLDLYSIKPDMNEGGYEAEAYPDFFYNVFSIKASPTLYDFLVIDKKEMEEGFEMDAGLLIEYPQVYERVEAWGKFMQDHPGHALCEHALMNYRIYLSTLLYGMDNSPVFEDDVLTADMKKLYETIQQQGKDALSRQIITDYYALLSKNGFKRRDENDQFLSQYDLGKAFGVKVADEVQ